MQIETSMKYYYIPSEWLKFEKIILSIGKKKKIIPSICIGNANWNFNEVLLYTIRMIKIWKDYTKYWQTGTLKVNHKLVQSFGQLFGKCLLMATQSSILAYGKSHGQTWDL